MSWKIYTPLEIDGDVHEFSNVNPANIELRKWVVKDAGFEVDQDMEFCLTFKSAPESQKVFEKGIRHFKNVLRRKCMTRSEQRKAIKNPKYDLKMFATIEGLLGDDIHCHVVAIIPKGMSFIRFKTAIRNSWYRIYGAGYQFDFQIYRGAKTIQYNSKGIGVFETDGLCSELTNF